MSQNPKKRLGFPKISAWKVGLLTTIITGLFSSRVLALDVTSLLQQLRNNPVLTSLVQELNKISTVFLPAIKNLIHLSDTDFNNITGVLGQMAPKETQEAVERTAAQSALNTSYYETIAAAVISEFTSNQALSKEAQEKNKGIAEVNQQLVDATTNTAADSQQIALDSESAQSSQDVLKNLSKQIASGSEQTAALSKLLAAQHAKTEETQVQLAALNQSQASLLKLQAGRDQEETLSNRNTRMASAYNRMRSYFTDAN
jgi:hypothetical protein